MFRGVAAAGRHVLPRHERRLAVLAERTAGKKNQKATYSNTRKLLEKARSRRHVHNRHARGETAHSVTASSQSHEAAEAESLRAEQNEWLREESGRHHRGRNSPTSSVRENKAWSDATEAAFRRRRDTFREPPQSAYGDVDERSGDSRVQTYFDSLVRDAVLRFGPPLPAEFVADNRVVTQSTGALRARRGTSPSSSASSAWRDDGADGSLFHMYDELALTTSELLTAIRKVEPSFGFSTHCDGVPFALLIKNCAYLRAFGGKVNMMRYLQREPDGRVAVSLAKYKMREVASQDGLRQGPQPWLYGGRM